MAGATIRQIVFGAATLGLLAGCVDGADSPTTEATSTTAPATKRGAAQEVEAPEVFQTTDTALWDGRPSLGGIWVASPDTKDPERVIMFNPANGQSVTGALFRRERDNPGPTLQLSSDAAEALGILAGQPASIKVTALRKVEAAEPEPAAPLTESSPEAAAGAPAETSAEATASAAGTTAIAAAALDAADGSGVPAADSVTEAVVEPPKPMTWRERRAAARAAREAERAAKAAAATAGATISEAPADGAVMTPIETAPLDARSDEVTATAEAAANAAAEPAQRKTRRQIRAEQQAAAEAAAAAASAQPAPSAPTEPSGRPIQIASFSSEENANRAVAALSKAGVTARPRQGETGGKVVWSVIATGDEALLQTIRKAGFADAFFLQ